MSTLGNLLAGTATAVGGGFRGYAQDEESRVKNALAKAAAAREERHLKVSELVAPATVRHLEAESDALGRPKAPDITYAPSKFVIEGTKDPVQGFASNRGGYFDANMRPITGNVKPYEEPKDDNTLVPVQRPDGSLVYTKRAEAAGQNAPSPSSTGNATIQKAIASNKTQLSVLNDALRELNAHPEAIGIGRGAGDLLSSVPVIGGAAAAAQDAVNQRIDPTGVNARASLANVGSLVIHDRSGAAVTVSEYPRLKPFVPTASDTPEAARDKIGKLIQAIQTETGYLSAGRGNGGASSDSTPSYEEWKKQNGIP